MNLRLTIEYLVIEVGSRLLITMTMKGVRFVDPVTNFMTELWWRMTYRCLDNWDKSMARLHNWVKISTGRNRKQTIGSHRNVAPKTRIGGTDVLRLERRWKNTTMWSEGDGELDKFDVR